MTGLIRRFSRRRNMSSSRIHCCYMGFPDGPEVKSSAWNEGDPGSIPGWGRSPGEGSGNPLQYSCLENPMEGGAWQATVHGVAKSQTQLSDFTFTEFKEKYIFEQDELFCCAIISSGFKEKKSFCPFLLLENFRPLSSLLEPQTPLSNLPRN